MSDSSHTDTQTWVHVEIIDNQGGLIWSFLAEDEKSFHQMAMDHDIELPVSCCSGACFVCACKVIKWLELVDVGKISVPLVDVEQDQLLSCVGGVISSALQDGGYHKIVLQKLL